MIENLVTLPPEIKTLIFIAVTVIVTQTLKWLGGVIKFDLSGYTAQVTSGIVAAVLVIVNAVLSHVPANAAPIVNSLLSFIVVILASWGAYKAARQFQGK